MRKGSLSFVVLFATFMLGGGAGTTAGDAASTPILPPVADWDGASRGLIADPDDPWCTPAEASGLMRTPRYEETFAWLQRLMDADPKLKAAFEARLVADEKFAADPRARLQWFYEKTPFFDSEHRLYPIGRSGK